MGEESYTWYRVRGWSRPGGFSLFGGWLTLPLLWFIHISHLQTQVFHFGVTTRHQHHQHPPLSHIHTGRKKNQFTMQSFAYVREGDLWWFGRVTRRRRHLTGRNCPYMVVIPFQAVAPPTGDAGTHARRQAGEASLPFSYLFRDLGLHANKTQFIHHSSMRLFNSQDVFWTCLPARGKQKYTLGVADKQVTLGNVA